MTDEPGSAPVTTGTSGIGALPARVLAAQLPLAAAWERVLEKAGMPGVDGIPVRRFKDTVPASLRALEQRLASG